MNNPTPTGIKKLALTAFGLLLVAVPFFNTLTSQRASALSGSNFSAGHIIDDVVFTDYRAMSVQDIQNFLDAKVGTCDNNGTGSAAPYNSGMTRAAYDASIGKNTKFICINQYYENTSTLANNLDGNPIPSGAISAAQIIYNAAQQYQINPQVLIATIQKEQGLVTDTWPWDSEYQKALGYACPDTAPCNTEYYGFYNQVTSAAWQFRAYFTNPTHYNYVVGTNTILWSPAAGCGGGSVNIQNQATAALYDYTPYQPNAAALAHVSDASNGGTGDGCSSYGNRNFWWYFNEWFGSSIAPAYSWSSQLYSITDANSVQQDPGRLQPGTVYTATLAALNTGNSTWTNTGAHPINLATANPQSHASSFCYSAWQSCTRPTALQEASVSPGEVGHFVFQFKTPYTVGNYREYFKPVAEFFTWFNDDMPDESFGINVVSPGTFGWYTSGYVIKDQNGVQQDPGRLQPGERYTATATAANTGTATWYNNGPMPVTLATAEPQSHSSSLCETSWLSCNRLAYLTESSVAPGQNGHFTFQFQAPYKPGPYRESFKPVAEFFSWFNDNDPNQSFGINVVSPGSFTWSTSGYVIKDQNGVQQDPGKLTHSQTYTATLTATNTGSATWYNNGPMPVTLATAEPQSHSSALCYNTWLTCSRLAYLTESSVAPGQIGHFTFQFQAPATLGSYRESFKPVAEFYSWFNDADPNQSFGIWVTQ